MCTWCSFLIQLLTVWWIYLVSLTTLKMICMYLLTKIVYILLLHDTKAVNHIPGNMRNLLNMVIRACKYMTDKNGFVEKIGPKMWLYLFMFRPITLKQFYSLTAIDTFSWLGCREVTLQTAVQGVPCATPGTDKDFNFSFFVWC